MIGADAGGPSLEGESCNHRGTNSGASGVKMEGFRLGEKPSNPSPSDSVRRLIVSDALISRVKFLMGEEMFSEMETVLTRPCRLSLFPVDRIGVNGLTPRTGDKSVFPSLVDGLEEDEEFSSAEGSTGDGGSLLEDVSLDSVLDVAPGPEESPEEELSSSTSMSELGQCPPGSLSAPSSSELFCDDT